MTPLIVLGFGIALLAMVSRKKKAPKAGGDIADMPGGGTPAPGPIDVRGGGKVEPGRPPMPAGGSASKEEVRAQLAHMHLPGDVDFPDSVGHGDAWVSDDCDAYVIGRDFFAEKAEDAIASYIKLVDDLLAVENPGLTELVVFSHPSEWDIRTIVEFKGGARYQNPSMVWALTRVPTSCRDLVPDPDDYTTLEQYDDAWTQFTQNHEALAEFVTLLAEFADEQMGTVWEDQFGEDEYYVLADEPILAKDEFDHRTAVRDVIDEFPGDNIIDMTDEVYHRLYSSHGICPVVIDPNDPEHKFCMELWLALRDLINLYLEG